MTKILIILPYADFREEEKREYQLKELLKQFKKFKKNYEFDVLVVEQVDPTIYFNRGQVINIGVRVGMERFSPDRLIFHDIDIIPNRQMFEEYFSTEYDSYSLMPINNKVYKRVYEYKLFAGSAVYSTTPSRFMEINGYPNNYWAWGGEDLSFHIRMKRNNVYVQYNENRDHSFRSTDVQRKNPKDKSDYLKKNKIKNMMVKELVKQDKPKKNGVAQVKYQIVDDSPNHIKVKLNKANLSKTIKHNEKIYLELGL